MDLQTSYGTAKGRESYSVRCLRVKAAYGDAAFELFRDGMSCEKIAKYIEITRLISGLDGFSAAERNEIVREAVQECTWNGETLFLRL